MMAVWTKVVAKKIKRKTSGFKVLNVEVKMWELLRMMDGW